MSNLERFFSIQRNVRTYPGYPPLRAVFVKNEHPRADKFWDSELVIYVAGVAIYRLQRSSTTEDHVHGLEEMMASMLEMVLMDGFWFRAEANAKLQIPSYPGFMLPAVLPAENVEGELLPPL